MRFLKNKILYMVGLSLLVLNTPAYGYNEKHLARLEECLNTPVNFCDLSHTDLSGLQNFDITKSFVDENNTGSRINFKIDFSHANLQGSKFSFKHTRFFGFVNFNGADLRGAEIRKASSLWLFSWKGAIYDNDTKFKGFVDALKILLFRGDFNPEDEGMIFVGEKVCHQRHRNVWYCP